MDINRAKYIISALAEGIDPTTGEVLSEDNVCNKGEVVRAFYAILNDFEGEKEVHKSNKKEPDEYDVALYERLKTLRNKIAKEKNFAPYMVISNTPLMHMAAQKPTSEKELKGIYGFGESKIQQYGTIFIGEIRDYIDGTNKEI